MPIRACPECGVEVGRRVFDCPGCGLDLRPAIVEAGMAAYARHRRKVGVFRVCLAALALSAAYALARRVWR